MIPLRILAAVTAAALLAAAPADAKTIKLGERTGGYVAIYQMQARIWLARKVTLEIHGDQISAAAIQVAWYRKKGGRVCYVPGYALYFHEGRNGRTGKRSDANLHVLKIHLKPGWYSPADFGIKPCGIRVTP